MAIRGIGFDYLGVIANLSGRGVFVEVGELIGLDKDTVSNAYHHYNKAFQTGEITKSELWQRVASELNETDHLDEIIHLVDADLPILNPDMLALVDRVRAANYKVGLLSNLASGTAWDESLRQQGIDTHFDVVLLSGDAGMSKPDPELYQIFCEKMVVKPNELIFTDDRESSLVSIDTLGITPILFTDQTQLEAEFAKRGINLQA